MKRNLWIAVLIGVCATGVWAAEPKPKPAAKAEAPAREKTEAELLADDLASRDASRRQEALAQVRELLAADGRKAANDLRARWLKAMLAGGMNDEILELTQTAILNQPTITHNVAGYQEYRVKALLATGRKEEALAAAKGLFNVAPMNITGQALLLVAECLRAIDPAKADAFREEQVAGAATRPADAATQPAQCPTLASIRVDAAPYEAAAANLAGAGDYNSLTGAGNLYLLADKPAEARAMFDRAYAIAPENQVAQATENIARTIKAQDGTIGRANGWILSLRP